MDGLLEEARDYLWITGDDPTTDKRLSGILERGEARLTQIAGASVDFNADSFAKSLLLDYCRYANSHALEVFEQNFQAELLALHLNYQVEVTEDGDQTPDPL